MRWPRPRRTPAAPSAPPPFTATAQTRAGPTSPVRPSKIPIRGRCRAAAPTADGLLGRLLGGRVGAVILALADAGRFAPASTQVIQLGTTYLAAADDLDRVG